MCYSKHDGFSTTAEEVIQAFLEVSASGDFLLGFDFWAEIESSSPGVLEIGQEEGAFTTVEATNFT